MEGPIHRENDNRMEERHRETETWTTKFMNLMIEWGRSCWKARNVMIYGEKRQHYTMERKKTKRRSESIFVCPERNGTGSN